MTLADLSAKSEISVRSITGFENGRKIPSASSVSALAGPLQLPEGFFYGSAVDEIPLASVSFRAISKMSALDRESALAAGQIDGLINEWIEQRFRLPVANLPTLPHLQPEEAADRVRATWGLGEAPIPNMVHLLESRGIRVFSLAADCTAIDAFSMRYRGVPFVILSPTKSGERGRFDAAHELGHLVLHSDDRLSRGPQAEDEANCFASAFLMPRSGILAQSLYEATPDRIIHAKRKWRVSALALTYRLHSLGLLSEWKYKNTAKQLAQLGYRRSEPGGIPRESSQLLGKVFTALRQPGEKASLVDELRLTSDELNLHVFGLVPVALDGGGQRVHGDRPSLYIVDGRKASASQSVNLSAG